MMKKINIAVTGYYATGSSALIDLLKEYDSVSIASPVDGDYEHMAFYTQGAFYDLASILLSPFRSVYGSDMAINEFIDAAKRLNDNDFGWYGSYQKYYGDQYMNSVYKFIDSISYKKDRKSAAHAIKVVYSFIKAIKQLAAKIIYKRPITSLGRKYIYDDKLCYFSMPTKDEFCLAAKEYTNSYIEMCRKDNSVNIFDHLIWPQQCETINEFMPDNLKIIVLDRDPRDVYLLNKYYWHKPPVSTTKPYYPTNPSDFVNEWRRTIQKRGNTDRVLFLHFEDLVYKYEETVKEIEKFIGLKSVNHTNKYSTFEPERSIENTQVFNLSNEWKKEVELIEKELSDYLYPFPYERTPDKKLWFDTDLQLTTIKSKKKIEHK